MPGRLGLIAARLFTQNGASTWIIACTITGAAAGAAALSPAHTTPARNIPAAISTPQATATPCMRFVSNAGDGCAGEFRHGWQHNGHRHHHRDWDDGLWHGPAQPAPSVPNSPNSGMIGAQTGGTF